MAELTETRAVDALTEMIGELSARQAELLECLRDIRRARGPVDLGIPAPDAPPPPPPPPGPALAPPPLASDRVSAGLALAPSLALFPPPTVATKRNYDYFADLDLRIAALAEGGDGAFGAIAN